MPMNSSASARALVRLAAWAVAIGLGSAVLQAFVAIAISGSVARIAALSSDDLGQAALAQVALTALLACATFALAALAGLSAELPVFTGAAAGAVAAMIPSLVLAMGEGAEALGPTQVALIRAGGLLVCAAAGAAGVLVGRKVVRR